MLFIPLILFISGCEKFPFDYRNKWTGEWELTYDKYIFGNQTTVEYTEQTTIEKAKKAELGKSLRINEFTFGVDRDDNLSLVQGKNQSIKKVGTIHENNLSFEVNTSINSPGVLYKVTATKLE